MFATNPFVTGAPGLRFYAGMPLQSADGTPIATLCVLDSVARPAGLTEVQQLTLRVLARQVEAQLELRRSIKERLGGEAAFLLHVSDFIWQHALPAPAAAGKARFPDFRRDEALMARLFEQFVRNFYRREQRQYRVFAETISWQATAPEPAALALLPTMLTDTTLESPTRKIILDTKYYTAALRPRYDQQKLISPHLYQLYAYLQNLRPAPRQALEGILLYPAAAATLDVRYVLGTYPVRVLTLNLHQPWSGIAADLLALVGGE